MGATWKAKQLKTTGQYTLQKTNFSPQHETAATSPTIIEVVTANKKTPSVHVSIYIYTNSHPGVDRIWFLKGVFIF